MINEPYYCSELCNAHGYVVHRGITNNPLRRQQEHQQQFPFSRLEVVSHPLTKEQALYWERQQLLTRTPDYHS